VRPLLKALRAGLAVRVVRLLGRPCEAATVRPPDRPAELER
jgi:hypothetical protein